MRNRRVPIAAPFPSHTQIVGVTFSCLDGFEAERLAFPLSPLNVDYAETEDNRRAVRGFLVEVIGVISRRGLGYCC